MNQIFTNISMDHGTMILSQQDVERLLHDDSPDSRTDVLEKISMGYNNNELQGRAREIAEQVFRLMMKDVALRVRETLSQRIKSNPNVPRDIVLHMAGDVESVAVPVLRESKVLSDADLVTLVEQSQDVSKLVAIAERESVSNRVSAALVETHYSQVMTSLLGNNGAQISDRSFEKIAEDFQNNNEVIELLATKPGLPITAVERIINRVSNVVAQQLKKQYKLDYQEIKRDSSAVREDIMLRLLNHTLNRKEIEELVGQMAAEDRLTPSIVMTALCRGQLDFFTIALAQFASIPISNAETLISDRGDNGFNGLYQKSGLPESMMDAVRLLLRAVQDMQDEGATPGTGLYANLLAERVISDAGSQSIEHLPYFIALIRQNTHR